ncbi:MAG: S24/S26 family peptidase [Candidatus Nanoarchaeia archaeon]
MDYNTLKSKIKKSWHWIWNSDSILSWLVALCLIFIFIKFILFPTLSLIMGTSLPLAGVESSSMDHQIVKDIRGQYTLCGNIYTKQEKEHINFNEYWQACGSWYEEIEISKTKFSDFTLKNGFRKGDIIIVWGRFKPKIGDIIIFAPNVESNSPHPIIHRIVNINEDGSYQTKGDHNEKQLIVSNNDYRTDETKIKENQIIGKAILKIPYLGWPKVFLSDLLKKITG